MNFFTKHMKSLHIENNASLFLKGKDWGINIVVEYPDQIHLDVAKVFHFFLLQLSLFFQEEHVQSHPQAYQHCLVFP